jgi:hypothetical protein
MPITSWTRERTKSTSEIPVFEPLKKRSRSNTRNDQVDE